MARVDFYQLSRDPEERVAALLAAKALEAGSRLVVVHGSPQARAALSQALWAHEGAFLAHGEAGRGHDDRQPILLSENCAASNGARLVLIADGEWREGAAGFERAILLFAPEQTEAARGLWARLAGSGQDLRIFKQGEGGGWREGR